VIDPTVELLGSGGKQTLTVQSDLNKLSQANQQQVSINVQNAMLHLTGHPPLSSSQDTTTTTTSAPTTTTTHAGAAAGTPTTTTSTTAPNNGVPATHTDRVSVTTVGPTWGSSITNDAIKALIIFFIVVAIYISIRFEPKMALAAFIAMIHDVLIAIGIYSIFNFQVTPDTVVAILTILGYSLYDTVVVFDRVRDNTRGIGSSGRLTYPQLINLSMNQTLARSINTSAVAILPVLAVLLIGAQLLGASTLQSYGLALFVGLLSGAYSSIFIASPVLCMMKEREKRWVDIANRLAKRGDTNAFYSAVDAANLGTAMSVAAAGQAGRAAAAPPAPAKSGAAKRSGLIRPGSGSRPSGGNGAGGGGGGSGTETAVMDRPPGGDATGASGHQARPTGSSAPKPRKTRGGKRKR
jgi:preprotein translocase subunit SecF